jgi:hypothetical protein
MNRSIRQEVTEGLLYTHSRINTNTRKSLEAASFLYALVELPGVQGSAGNLIGVSRAKTPENIL